MIKLFSPTIVMLVVLASTVCLMSLAQASEKPHGAAFVIQSHRGAGNLAPENTLESFKLAWKIGTVPEADVRATTDGVIVAFHDNDLKRLAPNADPDIKSKSVNDLSWAVASKLDVGEYKGAQFKGQHIPKIEDVFDAMKGHPERWLYLDVKLVPLEKMAQLARERGIEKQLILASTKYEHLREWKRLLPTSKTLLWMGEKEPRLRERMEELRKTNFADITQLQIHVRVPQLTAADPFDPTSAFLTSVRDEIIPKGILFQVLVIGTDSPMAYQKLMDLGVQSFATDDPLVTLNVMRQHEGSK